MNDVIREILLAETVQCSAVQCSAVFQCLITEAIG